MEFNIINSVGDSVVPLGPFRCSVAENVKVATISAHSQAKIAMKRQMVLT